MLSVYNIIMPIVFSKKNEIYNWTEDDSSLLKQKVIFDTQNTG